MLSPAERRQRLEARHVAWRPLSLGQALDDAAAAFADRPLILSDSRTWSYADVQRASRRMAAGLLAQGLRRGEHVGLIMANCAEFVIAKFAIARIGAVAVPINYLLRRDELAYVLAQSDCAALVTMDHFRDCAYLADLDDLCPGWEQRGGGSALPSLRLVFVHPMAGSARAGAITFADLDIGPGPDLADIETAVGPDDCSDVVYTSGTTGRPKGVMLTHQMILRTAYASAYTRAFEDGRRIAFALPMYHVFGYVECLVACLFVGGAIVPMLTFDAAAMIDAAERHRASEMVCVPMMTQKLLDVARGRGFDSSALIAVFNSGGTSPPTIWSDIRQKLGAREVLTAYGMTETTASIACTLPEGADGLLLTTNGRMKAAGIAGDPGLGGALAIYKSVDPDTGLDLPPGHTGELVVRGAIVTRGYYRKPDETAAAFDAQGWLHTGDLGMVSEDGFVTLQGRIKESYRCGSEMVMPQEIEALLADIGGVHAYVVGVPDAKMGEVGCICIVAAGEPPDASKLIELCIQRFARFKVPRHAIVVAPEQVPMTATGRVQRAQLTQLARQRLAPP